MPIDSVLGLPWDFLTFFATTTVERVSVDTNPEVPTAQLHLHLYPVTVWLVSISMWHSY